MAFSWSAWFTDYFALSSVLLGTAGPFFVSIFAPLVSLPYNVFVPFFCLPFPFFVFSLLNLCSVSYPSSSQFRPPPLQLTFLLLPWKSFSCLWSFLHDCHLFFTGCSNFLPVQRWAVGIWRKSYWFSYEIQRGNSPYGPASPRQTVILIH